MEATKTKKIVSVVIILLAALAIFSLAVIGLNKQQQAVKNYFGDEYPIDEAQSATIETSEEIAFFTNNKLKDQIKKDHPSYSIQQQELLRQQLIKQITDSHQETAILDKENNLAQELADKYADQISQQLANSNQGNDDPALNNKLAEFADQLQINTQSQELAQNTVNEIQQQVTLAIQNNNLDSRKKLTSTVNIYMP